MNFRMNFSVIESVIELSVLFNALLIYSRSLHWVLLFYIYIYSIRDAEKNNTWKTSSWEGLFETQQLHFVYNNRVYESGFRVLKGTEWGDAPRKDIWLQVWRVNSVRQGSTLHNSHSSPWLGMMKTKAIHMISLSLCKSYPKTTMQCTSYMWISAENAYT